MSVLHRQLPWLAVVVLPLLILFALLRHVVADPAWVGPTFHFYIVSMTSLIALFLAVVMSMVSGQLKDARVFFLALAFMGLCGIFLVHALTTPGALVPGPNPWVGLSARLSLFVGAIFLAASTVVWRPSIQREIVRRRSRITALFVLSIGAYGLLAITESLRRGGEAVAEYGEYGAAPVSHFFDVLSRPALSWSLSLVTLALLGLVIVRYTLLYRLTRTPLLAGFLVSGIFLAQGQLSMTLAPVWRASWWEYHVLLLAAFCAALIGLVREYALSGNLQDVVEGLLLRDTIAQLQRGYTDVIVALVGAVEAKDPYTRGHTQRVAELSLLIGRELRLPPERLRVLSQAAMLHDIGKIGIPDSILNKPGPLTDEEFQVIKEHPVRGHQIIKDVRSLQQEIGGVRHHHERLDGSGYPDGLAGDAIPLEARIIAVADVLDALTSARSYRGPWTLERALTLLDQEAGSTLDRRCVEALHRALPAWSDLPEKATHAVEIPLSA